MSGQTSLLESRWDDAYAAGLDEPGKLLYRSNLLGADKRITNYGGGNTVATRMGKKPTAATLKRFYVGPFDCEVTGLCETPDGKTIFVNIQHPGEDGTLAAPTSAWPDSQTNAGSKKRPRSATVVITRTDGGAIGV